jgi:hypothetical protein
MAAGAGYTGNQEFPNFTAKRGSFFYIQLHQILVAVDLL